MHKPLASGIVLIAGILLASTVQAQVPFFNASCPGRVDVHADDGGPVFINGKQAKLKRFNSNYYEARFGKLTIAISVNPDGRPEISYTAAGGGNGVCRVKGGRSAGMQDDRENDGYLDSPPRRPSGGVSLEMMPAFCRGEASAQFGLRPNRITMNMPFRSGRGYVVQGNYPDGSGRTSFFNCWFDRDGNFVSMN